MSQRTERTETHGVGYMTFKMIEMRYYILRLVKIKVTVLTIRFIVENEVDDVPEGLRKENCVMSGKRRFVDLSRKN